MQPMKKLFALLTVLSLAALDGFAKQILDNPAKGTAPVASINVLSFAPEGVLLVGDGTNRKIVAISTGDTTELKGEFGETKGFGSEIAGRLGVKAGDVEIIDIAVNPASRRLYAAVRKQDDKSQLVVTLPPGGKVEHFSFEDREYAVVPLPEGVSRVTDIVWVGGKLVAAARANEEFASKIYAVDGPVQHNRGGQLYSAETYHVSHRRWETKAPMSVMLPYEEDGKHYIVGAFSCTPVVKYPIDAIQPGAKINGISMIELGSGNRPLDMFGYEKDGKASVLTNTYRFHHSKQPYGPSPHLAFRFDEALLGSEKTNEGAIHRTRDTKEAAGKIDIAEPYHGVVHMDRLDSKSALALRETNGKDFDLVTIALP
jgi:hypothetical protein